MANLTDIERKVHAGERLSFEDGVRLFQTDDVFALGRLANEVRERKNGNHAYYVRNLHLNYSNVCIFDCHFCAFYRREGQEGAWEMDLDAIFAYASRTKFERLDEIHIVGGVHPKLPYRYYLEMLRGLKERYPKVHLKAFTATEIDHLVRLSKKSLEETLRDLMDAGLDSLPGGGAEIFHPEVRTRISHDKATAEQYLEVHDVAHRLGMKTNVTMLYGHIETFEHRVDHILRLGRGRRRWSA